MKKAPGKIFAFFQTGPAGSRRARKSRGQSLVEIAIAFPVLIMLLAGLVEFGFMLNYYLSLMDATRESARTFNNFTPFEEACTCDIDTACKYDDPPNNPDCIANCVTDYNDSDCDSTSFYQGAAGMVFTSLRPKDINGDGELSPEERAKDSSRKIDLDPDKDDVVVSVLRIKTSAVLDRFPEDGGEYHLFNNQPSRLSTVEIGSRLVSGAPDTGVLLVEVFFNYHQVLALPWLAPFLPDPILLHAYTIMPLPAAEPP